MPKEQNLPRRTYRDGVQDLNCQEINEQIDEFVKLENKCLVNCLGCT